MPEIKIKHVVSFSSEDKVHKAENLLKEETYRKWKCASPGEKNATIVLQFEKATKIHSIDIGNDGSAFVEVLVGRSSDSVNDYQVLLVASSFMSPLESRNGTHMNRVRMFGPEKLSQNVKDEKWDCVQVVCTQPFNKNIQYGLTFIRFHSPPEKIEEQPNSEKPVKRLGAFKLKDDDEEDSLPSPGSWFEKQKTKASESSSGSISNQASQSYAAAVLASNNNALKDTSMKRKADQKNDASEEPPMKKTPLNKNHIVYKDMDDSVQGSPQSVKTIDSSKKVKAASSPNVKEKKKDVPSTSNVKDKKKDAPSTPSSSQQSANNNNSTPAKRSKQTPFNKIMDRVVFVLSGFVNPLRSDLREKALEMGAKYKPDWDSTCTHLVCAFAKTPKYDQVKKVNGRIVKKEWILDCYKKKESLLWRRYELSSGDSSDEQDDSDKDPNYKDDGGDDDDDDSDVGFIVDSDDEEKDKKKKKTVFGKKRTAKAADSPNKKKPQSPKKQTVKTADTSSSDLSRTPTKKTSNVSDSEDELDALKTKDNSNIFNKRNLQQNSLSDNSQSPTLIRHAVEDDNSQSSTVMKYTVEDESETEDEDALQDYIADTDVEDDSGGDTEDEIRKVENKLQKKKTKMNGASKTIELSEKPDVSDLPLPELPDFFKKKHFLLYGDFSSSKQHELQRYITAYNGVLEDYMDDKVKYVITEQKWDSNFDAALSANEDLIFVRPTWIYKCHEAGKRVPYQPHVVIPDT